MNRTNDAVSEITVSRYLVQFFEALGISVSFGVSGGAIAPIWEDLTHSSVRVVHCRHEVGAVYSAIEAYFASGVPAVVFTTTGPGITNALTGIALAKVERAKMIFIAALTPHHKAGSRPLQESNARSLAFLDPGNSMVGTDYVGVIQSPADLPGVVHQIGLGLAGDGGFVASILIASDIMAMTTSARPQPSVFRQRRPGPAPSDIAQLARQLHSQTALFWIGDAYRGLSAPLLSVAEKLSAAVMTSPEAKGVFPERHELCLGVSGLGADTKKIAGYLRDVDPQWVFVIGTHLDEMTSEWRKDRIAGRKIVYINREAGLCNAWLQSSDVEIWNVDAAEFLAALDQALVRPADRRVYGHASALEEVTPRPVRAFGPSDVMGAIQEWVIDSTDAIVMADCGNAMAWAASHLRFQSPGRFRGSYKFGPMGQFACGVVGASCVGRTALAIVGDGAMLMNNEISTAVALGLDAKWVVLNDSNYNMCRQGLRLMGRAWTDTNIPSVSFDQYAISLGARAIRVDRRDQLNDALRLALSSPGPFVVDAVIDPDELAPIGGRLEVLEDFRDKDRGLFAAQKS